MILKMDEGISSRVERIAEMYIKGVIFQFEKINWLQWFCAVVIGKRK